jgi:hypothetical protein
MTQQQTPGYNANLVDVDLEDDLELNTPVPTKKNKPTVVASDPDKETQLINNDQRPNVCRYFVSFNKSSSDLSLI